MIQKEKSTASFSASLCGPYASTLSDKKHASATRHVAHNGTRNMHITLPKLFICLGGVALVIEPGFQKNEEQEQEPQHIHEHALRVVKRAGDRRHIVHAVKRSDASLSGASRINLAANERTSTC